MVFIARSPVRCRSLNWQISPAIFRSPRHNITVPLPRPASDWPGLQQSAPPAAAAALLTPPPYAASYRDRPGAGGLPHPPPSIPPHSIPTGSAPAPYCARPLSAANLIVARARRLAAPAHNRPGYRAYSAPIPGKREIGIDLQRHVICPQRFLVATQLPQYAPFAAPRRRVPPIQLQCPIV